jgi:hypothetical protein
MFHYQPLYYYLLAAVPELLEHVGISWKILDAIVFRITGITEMEYITCEQLVRRIAMIRRSDELGEDERAVDDAVPILDELITIARQIRDNVNTDAQP